MTEHTQIRTAAEQAAPAGLEQPEAQGGVAASRKTRGPYKPRTKPTAAYPRTNNPAQYLPGYKEAHRIAKERGKPVGRPRGSRNGWTREERALSWEYAKAQAKLEVNFLYEVDYLPEPEERKALYRLIDPDLAARYRAMLDARKARGL